MPLAINDEMGVQAENEQHFPKGEKLTFTAAREKELHEKKQYIIKLMDKVKFVVFTIPI